jgi:hypothetical protein
VLVTRISAKARTKRELIKVSVWLAAAGADCSFLAKAATFR